MTQQEHDKLQEELSALLKKPKYRAMRSQEREGFRTGVLACKSVLCHYDPYKKELGQRSKWIRLDQHGIYEVYECPVCGAAIALRSDRSKDNAECWKCGERYYDGNFD